MTAPTKSFTSIADTSIDADSPLDETLLTAIRDNIEHIEEWLGASFTAAQDHNHDGVNSAAIEIGPNLLRNGSFESGTTGWTAVNFTGGTVATNTANDMDGATALGFTSTSTANGGGDAVSNEFVPVAGSAEVLVKWSSSASVANVSSKVEVQWFDDTQSLISSTTVFSTTNTNTTAKKRQRIAVAPSTARYCKVRITGGVPASGSATGTIYFDGVKLSEPSGALILLDSVTASASASVQITEGMDGTFDAYELHLDGFRPATSGATLQMRVSVDGGASDKVGATDYGWSLTGNGHLGTDRSSNSSGAVQWNVSAAAGVSNVNAEIAFHGVLRFNSPHLTDQLMVTLEHAAFYDTTQFCHLRGTLFTADFNAAVNALSIFFSSGNITSGTARLYGVRKGA